MYTCMVKLRSWLYYIFSIAVNNTYGKEVGTLFRNIGQSPEREAGIRTS